MSSSGSLFFTGIVIILIMFQIAMIVQFLGVNAKLDMVIENQELLVDILTPVELSDGDKSYMERLTLRDYEECINPDTGGSKEMCSRIERLLKFKGLLD